MYLKLDSSIFNHLYSPENMLEYKISVTLMHALHPTPILSIFLCHLTMLLLVIFLTIYVYGIFSKLEFYWP